MEEEKRKRGEKESNEDQERILQMKKKKKIVKKAAEETTEEEVEEFFAILKRMQVAVKYFGEGWRAAVETDATAVVVDHSNIYKGNEQNKKEKEKIRSGAGMVEGEINGVLDLNTIPTEGESTNVNGKA